MKYSLETLTEAFVKHIKYHHGGVIYATEEDTPDSRWTCHKCGKVDDGVPGSPLHQCPAPAPPAQEQEFGDDDVPMSRHPVAQEQGDEATVEAMAKAAMSCRGEHVYAYARAILAAIRRGDVPLPDDTPQIKALIATCTEWERANAAREQIRKMTHGTKIAKEILCGETFLLTMSRQMGSTESDEEILARFAHCRDLGGIYHLKADPCPIQSK